MSAKTAKPIKAFLSIFWFSLSHLPTCAELLTNSGIPPNGFKCAGFIQNFHFGSQQRPIIHPSRDPHGKVKSQSLFARFVIALHSPSGLVETGLPFRPPEKMATNLGCGPSAALSPVRFRSENRRIAALSGDVQGNAGQFLCNPD